MKKFSQEFENKIIQTYQETKNIGIVARNMSKQRTTILRVLKRNNIEVKKNIGEKKPGWMGENASYSTIHDWVRRWKIKQINCELCKESKKLEVHNINGLYKRNLSDWVWLCRKCHQKVDGRINKRDAFGKFYKQEYGAIPEGEQSTESEII